MKWFSNSYYFVEIIFVLIKFANFFILLSFPYLQCMAAYIILIYLSFFKNLPNYKKLIIQDFLDLFATALTEIDI